jgi:hypothetical protein
MSKGGAPQLDMFTPQEIFLLRLSIERVLSAAELLRNDLVTILGMDLTTPHEERDWIHTHSHEVSQHEARDAEGPPIW